MGEIDSDGIAEWYSKCKVRKEGNLYIATPHTTNPTRRTVNKQKEITVSVKDGKYTLEQPIEDTAVKDGIKSVTIDSGQVAEPLDKSPSNTNKQASAQVTTFQQIFDKLFDRHFKLKPYIRKQQILQDMLPLFENSEDAGSFVNGQWKRQKRNAYTRKQRFEYKAYNQNYEYFFTVTFDNKKHTEQSFERSLKNTFSNLHKRYGCLFQGVWERGSENDRLHFHGLIYDSKRKILDGLDTVTDYNPQTGRKKTYLQSKYFFEKYGRNEFSKIIPQTYESAIKYITKYLSKQNVRPYYSKGLYRFIESDIDGKDVIAKMDITDERDIRLIVASNFTVWQDAVMIGEASTETMAQAKKVP